MEEKNQYGQQPQGYDQYAYQQPQQQQPVMYPSNVPYQEPVKNENMMMNKLKDKMMGQQQMAPMGQPMTGGPQIIVGKEKDRCFSCNADLEENDMVMDQKVTCINGWICGILLGPLGLRN